VDEQHNPSGDKLLRSQSPRILQGLSRLARGKTPCGLDPDPQRAFTWSLDALSLPPEREFAEAVEHALEGRMLRYSKRLELLQLARELHLERFQAAVIIAQVQYRKGQLGYLPDVSEERDKKISPRQEPAGRRRRSELLLKIAALILTAALADLIIVRALLG